MFYGCLSKQNDKKVKQLFLICLLLFANTGIAQQGADIDSLKAVLAKSTPGSSLYLQTKVNLANALLYTDSLKNAIKYIDEVLDYPQADQILPTGYSRHYLVKAWTYHGNNKFKEAKTYYEKAFSIALAHDDKKAIQEIELNLGAVLVDIRDPKAEAFALGMIERANETGNETEKQQWLLGNLYLARTYDFENKLHEALQVLNMLQASPVFNELQTHRYGVLNAVAIVLGRIGDHELAVNYYKKALRSPNLYGFEKKHLLLNLASTWVGYGQPDSCLYYLNKAKEIAALTDDEYWEFSFSTSRALKQKGRQAAANIHIDSALQVAKRIGNKNYIVRSLVKKAEYDAADGNWPSVRALLSEAEPYWQDVDNLEANTLAALLKLKAGIALYNPALMQDMEAYLALNTSYTHLKTDEQLKHMVYQYQVKEKEQENEILRQELELQQQRRKIISLILILMAVVAAAGSVTAVFWHRNARLARKYNALLEEEKEQLIFEKEELQTVNQDLQRLIAQRQQKAMGSVTDTVEIVGRDKIHFIPATEISHLIAEAEGVRYYLANRTSIWSDAALKDVADQLPDTHFIRVYRSVVVNIRHIDWINHSSLRMKDNTDLPIGRTYKQQIKDLFGNL